MKAWYEHLLSSVPIQSDEEQPKTYYEAVNELPLEEAKTRIEDVLNDALEEKKIPKQNIVK